MTAIVYVHGFNSSGGSAKVESIRQAFPAHAVYAPTVSHQVSTTVRTLRDLMLEVLVKHAGDVVVVGTSMGGFWAHWIGSVYGVKALLINPAVDPANDLTKYIGTKAGGRTWTQADCEDYRWLSFGNQTEAIRLVVALDDAVCPAQRAIDKYQGRAACSVYESGGHRFENYDAINSEIAALINSEGLGDANQ